MNGQYYEASGNQTSLNGNTAIYDALGRMMSIAEQPAFGGGTETLAYDGLDERVLKTTPGGNTTYVYDVFGGLAAEYTGSDGFERVHSVQWSDGGDCERKRQSVRDVLPQITII